MTQAADDRQIRLENAELLRSVMSSIQEISAEVKDIQRRVIIIETRDHTAQIAALALRVTALEVESNKRDGATGVISALLKSPALGWLAGAAITAWAVLTERVNL